MVQADRGLYQHLLQAQFVLQFVHLAVQAVLAPLLSCFSFSYSAVVILKFPFLTIQSNIAAKPVLRAIQRVFINRLKSLSGLFDKDEKLTDNAFRAFQSEKVTDSTTNRLDVTGKRQTACK
jgi:hypothetical protein